MTCQQNSSLIRHLNFVVVHKIGLGDAGVFYCVAIRKNYSPVGRLATVFGRVSADLVKVRAAAFQAF